MGDEVERLFREGGLIGGPHTVDSLRLLKVLQYEYGIIGRLTRIPTEKDATYHLRGCRDGADDEHEFLVKVSQPDEPIDVVRCQVDVVGWIESQDPGIPVQSVLPARDGTLWRHLLDDRDRFQGVLRVHRFIPGRLLAEESPSPAHLRLVGAALGRVDLALNDFAHPGESRAFVWDLTRFLSFEPLVANEEDPRRRTLAQEVFDAFRERVVAALPEARKQVIHGDFSPYNVVVDSDTDQYVTGVLDFGDTIRSPVIFDPAVLLGNHLLPAPNHPWEQAREALDGYRDVFPLSQEEVSQTAVASAARVTLRALVAARRLREGTDRAEYVIEHAQHDWARIENVVALGFDAAYDFLLHT